MDSAKTSKEKMSNKYQMSEEKLVRYVLSYLKKRIKYNDIYVETLYDDLFNYIHQNEYLNNEIICFPKSTHDILSNILIDIDNNNLYEFDEKDYINVVKDYVVELENFIENENDAKVTTDTMKLIIAKAIYYKDEKKTTDEEKRICITYLKKLKKKDISFILFALGYVYYSGLMNEKQDFRKSEKYLLKYYEMKKNIDTANTLGYIYYYGRVNNGIPQYDKAYKYFSIGALGGNPESIYKVADMFYNGYGIGQNRQLAYTLVSSLYHAHRTKFEKKAGFNNFADISLRLSKYYREGYAVEKNIWNSYEYLLEAKVAILERIAHYKEYGDEVVLSNIMNELKSLETELFKNKKHDVYIDTWLPNCIEDDFFETYKGVRYKFILKITKDKNKTYKFVLTRKCTTIPDWSNTIITLSDISYCKFTNEITFYVKNIKKIPSKYIDKDIDIKYLESFNDGNIKVYLNKKGKKFVVSFDTLFIKNEDAYKLKNIHKKNLKLAKVEFTPNGKLYDYLCKIKGIKIGDKVIVKTARGDQVVTIKDISKIDNKSLALPIECYKEISSKLISID